MTRLARKRFDRRFQDFIALGRARLPALAPAWTDHNAHDPGITLMELLAWVAEAQSYALGHAGRETRAAFAALSGVDAAGTRAAQGLLWPDPHDVAAPWATEAQARIVRKDARIHPSGEDALHFHPVHDVLWVPGTVSRVATRGADGRTTVHRQPGRRDGPPFLPFGARAGARDVLMLDFESRGRGGLFPPRRADAKDAYWTIGVRADANTGADAAHAVSPSTLEATIVADGVRTDVPIVADTTSGLLRTGALSLDVAGVPGSPRRLALELHARRGSDRMPRIVHIEPNVLPIRQGRAIAREVHAATGVPDWGFALDEPGLRFDANEAPLKLEVDERARRGTWQRRVRLDESGPQDEVYVFDPATGTVVFGNGVNGRAPPAGAEVVVAYAVCDGVAGNIARHRAWHVQGFDGVFGVNPDALTGGGAPLDGVGQRRLARKRVRCAHALVTARDIAEAALALPLMDLARAWVVPPPDAPLRTTDIALVVVREQRAGDPPPDPREMRRWRDTIRRRLSPRLPLGSRLRVVSPRDVVFSVHATVEAAMGYDVDKVRGAIIEALRDRFVDRAGAPQRAPGVDVDQRDVEAWVRKVDGVARVASLALQRPDGTRVDTLVVPRDGLPRFDDDASNIVVQRPARRA